jgi:hypothetical protein
MVLYREIGTSIGTTRYIYLLGIYYGFFTRGEHYGPGHFIEKMDAAICSNLGLNE